MAKVPRKGLGVKVSRKERLGKGNKIKWAMENKGRNGGGSTPF
jgi:hypothetical protein